MLDQGLGDLVECGVDAPRLAEESFVGREFFFLAAAAKGFGSPPISGLPALVAIALYRMSVSALNPPRMGGAAPVDACLLLVGEDIAGAA